MRPRSDPNSLNLLMICLPSFVRSSPDAGASASPPYAHALMMEEEGTTSAMLRIVYFRAWSAYS